MKRTLRFGRRSGREWVPLSCVIPTLVVLLALFVPTVALAQERTVTVSGTATQQVPNDSAGLSFSVSKERRSRQVALRAVAIRLRMVIAAVQAVPGVGPGDITTGSITIRKGTRGKRAIYIAVEGISVTLHQPERAGELTSVAIAIEEGGEFNFLGAAPHRRESRQGPSEPAPPVSPGAATVTATVKVVFALE